MRWVREGGREKRRKGGRWLRSLLRFQHLFAGMRRDEGRWSPGWLKSKHLRVVAEGGGMKKS